MMVIQLLYNDYLDWRKNDAPISSKTHPMDKLIAFMSTCAVSLSAEIHDLSLGCMVTWS